LIFTALTARILVFIEFLLIFISFFKKLAVQIFLIVLAGGFGERLFPISTKEMPKQFIKFCSTGESLFQRTMKRIRFCLQKEEIIIICNVLHFDIVYEQIYELGEKNCVIILEPVKKNTMGSLLLALKYLKDKSKDLLFVSPTDSYIEDIASFVECFNVGRDLSFKEKKHILFGVMPMEANLNYGYIEVEKEFFKKKQQCFFIKSFHEKPSLQTCEFFLEQGIFFWNSGSFVFNADLIEKDVKKYCKNIIDLVEKIDFISFDKNGIKTFKPNDNFNLLPQMQIDKTMVEKNENLLCIKSTFDWCDIGTKEALNKMIKNGKIVVK